MSGPYGTTAKYTSSPEVDAKLELVLPISGTLKDGSGFKIYRVTRKEKHEANDSKPAVSIFLSNKPNLTKLLSKLLDDVIETGNEYPQLSVIGIDGFMDYFLSHDAFVLVSSSPEIDSSIKNTSLDSAAFWESNVKGMFYIKPNFPGRSSHICNGGFITSPKYRGCGVAKQMGTAFIKIAPILGYKASLFNLVFATNEASLKVWRDLGFKESGRIPKAGFLKDYGYVDAINFFYDFGNF
ncbi:hypothetical protein BB560_002588 [Smittium megazygosporum]|uniref:N-acetyltransferase domain-containing protein n=1 Tax=Smittium megazygosporum TaxID=133381 RepID=A0A2T9XWN3_9FUNG|nr:hypothetical protein BB560_007345 [Smittium megazygosporum]PVV02947.1 hypothetical protein BB560_002588 [Smittium megazygosporum]